MEAGNLLLLLLVNICLCWPCSAVDRVYFIASVDVEWDYAPNGTDLVHSQYHEKSKVFLEQSSTRIGRKYMKVVYREYTDATFTQQAARPMHLGLLGPVLRAEVGDTFVIHFRNMATKGQFSVHPHGVQYEKDSEGAKYLDGTSGADKEDDGIAPGGNYTYKWKLLESEAPSEDDPPCVPWVYHSHWITEKDTNLGLIGFLLTCKKGSLDESGKVKGVNKEFFLLFNVIDENESWYLDRNIAKYANASAVDKEDEDFKESNLMHSVNGLMYNNLPDLRMCRNSTATWYLLGMGNEVDIHGIHFHGQTVTVHGHRTDNLQLFPAEVAAVDMVPQAVGKWMLECNVYDHHMAGMLASFVVDTCGTKDPAAPTGKTRNYYISADMVEWDYAPSGENLFSGGRLTDEGTGSEVFFKKAPNRIGGKYMKALYRGYTDATFSTALPHKNHLGVLGPIIRAEVGDTVQVVFRNNASRNYSMVPRGMFFNHSDHATERTVAPNEKYTYTWTVPETYSPLEGEAACLTWMYHSPGHPQDTYSGLVGPMMVCKKGALDGNGKQIGVDKEFFIFMTVFDENESWYIDDNIKKYCTGTVDKDDEDFKESNKMHGINGYLYANLPGLDICVNDQVSLHVIGLGTEADLHTLQLTGNQIIYHDMHRIALPISPGTLATLHMKAYNKGVWALLCRTNEHLLAGTTARYNVTDCQGPPSSIEVTGLTRTYYIAAKEVEWDYTPINKLHPVSQKPLVEDENSKVFIEKGPHRIGSKYKKVVYRAYTDSTFTKEIPRNDRDKHLGLFGPFIKAEVNERIKVVFKNMASRNYSIHASQVYFNKTYEGALYRHNHDDTRGAAVPPGETFIYHWQVPELNGPGPKDPNCVTSPYFSATDMVKDTNSGLIGPLVICRKGTLGDHDRRKDVDREIALLFTVTEENESWYLDENIQKYCSDPSGVDKDDDDFKESNKMHGINGRVYANVDGLQMKVGEKVTWYLIGMGDEVDIHTVHFHGTTVQRFTDVTHRSDVIGLFPGTSHVAEMIPHTPATWLVHCHVTDHITAGMEALYHISPKTEKMTTPRYVGSAAIFYIHGPLIFICYIVWFTFA